MIDTLVLNIVLLLQLNYLVFFSCSYGQGNCVSVPTRYRLNDKQGKMGNCLSNYGHNISHRY